MPDLILIVTIFILAIFVGLEVISKVPQALHTPLMSATNAIHGVVLVGGLLILGGARTLPMMIIGAAAALFGTLNVVGGFVVTDRMLEMFKQRKKVQK
jgi:NAD(P) transhydrogenase subunit alpha